MPNVKATEEFKTITLQQIADSITKEEIREVANGCFDMSIGKDAKITKEVTENQIKFIVDDEIETTFTLNGTILSSNEVKSIDGDYAKLDFFHMYMTEEVFTAIFKLMGYKKDIINLETEFSKDYTIEKEGIQRIEGKEGEYNTTIYQIDLSKKVSLTENTQKPEEPKKNEVVVGNNTIDNTISKDKLPQTGSEVMLWIGALIGVLVMVAISRMIILYKNRN